MAETERLPGSFARRVLPFGIGIAALLLYLVTLHPWLSANSLMAASKTLDLDWWSPHLQAPLYYLITLPVRWLPLGSQIPALNVLSALCAAGSLALLARSVALLPQDRTKNQRMRDASGRGVLCIGTNWLPPIAACALLAFQMTFWENAISASQEMLNLLLFAYVVRCLVEYRVSRESGWMYRLALVYGLGLANNWAMWDFLPGVGLVMVVLMGGEFFKRKFFVRLVAFGGIGLLLFLVLPIKAVVGGGYDMGFWELLRWELGMQKLALLRYKGWILCVLPSVLALGWMGLRWASHSGEVSGLSLKLSAAMHRVVPLILLALNAWVFFDRGFSPRLQVAHLTLLPLYFLSALAVGYFCGYWLLLGQPIPGGGRPPRGGAGALLLEKFSLVIAWAVLVAPLAVLLQNAPKARQAKQAPLRELAGQLRDGLPAQPATVLSDNPLLLMLIQATYQSRGQSCPHALLDTRSLTVPAYHQMLARRYPGLWKDRLNREGLKGGVPPLSLIALLADQARSQEVYYLHPSFGYYFEAFHSHSLGPVRKLELYGADMVRPPALTAEVRSSNNAFWKQLPPLELSPEALKDKRTPDAVVAGRVYARAVNEWGVRLQREGHLDEARQAFEKALVFYPSNYAAQVNLRVNRRLLSRQPAIDGTIEKIEDAFGPDRDWNLALNEFGQYDEPRLCFSLGQAMAQGGLPRQASFQFARASALDPTNGLYAIAEAEMYLQGRMTDLTLSTLGKLRSSGVFGSMNLTNRLLGVRLEAMAYLARTNAAGAEKVLRSLGPENERHPMLHDAMVQTLVTGGKFAEALRLVQQQLDAGAEPVALHLQKASLQLRLKDPAQALESLAAVLKRDNKNLRALEMRAATLIELKRIADARADYQAMQKLAPLSPVPLLGLAEASLREGSQPEAILHLEAALKLAPPNSREAAVISARLQQVKGGQR